jgi:type II secretory pathway component PulM
MPPLLLGAIFWLMGGLPVPMHERWFLIGSIFALQLGITYQVFQRPFTRRLQLFWKQSQLADS